MFESIHIKPSLDVISVKIDVTMVMIMMNFLENFMKLSRRCLLNIDLKILIFSKKEKNY